MREKYWNMYVDIKHRSIYYAHYQISAKRKNAVVTAICLIASASSIAGWQIWSSYPVLWGAIICLAQLIQVLKPIFPFSKQITGFCFLCRALTRMLLEVDDEWTRINHFDEDGEDEIEVLIRKRRKELASLESQFLGDIYLPFSEACDKKAERDCKRYFNYWYPD